MFLIVTEEAVVKGHFTCAGGRAANASRTASGKWLPYPVAVPGIFVGDGAPSSSADRCHSLRSLLPPPAALPSLPPRPVVSFTRRMEFARHWSALGNVTWFLIAPKGAFFAAGRRGQCVLGAVRFVTALRRSVTLHFTSRKGRSFFAFGGENWDLSFRYAPHPKPPLCKGRCQPNRLTEGLTQ